MTNIDTLSAEVTNIDTLSAEVTDIETLSAEVTNIDMSGLLGENPLGNSPLPVLIALPFSIPLSTPLPLLLHLPLISVLYPLALLKFKMDSNICNGQFTDLSEYNSFSRDLCNFSSTAPPFLGE